MKTHKSEHLLPPAKPQGGSDHNDLYGSAVLSGG